MDIEKYRSIPYETRECCLICGKKATDPVIDMPDFPLTEIYVDRKIEEKLGYVDQSFCFCPHCGHGQIKNVIDVELQYGDVSTYYFRTSQSISGRETTGFFIDFFNSVVKNRTFRTIVEIGCNDLYLLKSLQSRADKLIGIDPILKGNEERLTQGNIIAIGDFFENVDLDTDIDVVICKDTLEHVSYPRQFMNKIVEETSKNTLFFFQFPILETLLADCRFDQVFHQHLNYFSFKSLFYMLDELGCGLVDYTIDFNHWSTLLVAFRKGIDNSKYRNTLWNISAEDILERYELFKRDMEQTNRRLEYFRDEVLYGYGAALMLPVLAYHLGNDLSCLRSIIDDDKNKDGLYYINLPVRIAHSSKIDDISNSVVLLTAIFSKMTARRILSNLFKLNPKHVICPLGTI